MPHRARRQAVPGGLRPRVSHVALNMEHCWLCRALQVPVAMQQPTQGRGPVQWPRWGPSLS